MHMMTLQSGVCSLLSEIDPGPITVYRLSHAVTYVWTHRLITTMLYLYYHIRTRPSYVL